jgi:hypothetical protein
MATLPTYENAGVQYADLPRVNTAPQQVAAQGFATIGQNIDRMTAFFQGQAATDAQQAGLKYAIDFPPTLDQLETAKRTGQMPVVQGGGRIFADSYNKATAHILGTNIIGEFQNRQSERLMRLEAGERLDPTALKEDIRADIDGNVSLLTKINPETSIQVRAQMTTLGHAVYKQALMFDEKARQAAYQVDLSNGLSKIAPVLENVIKEYSKINLPAGELEQVLENVIYPFTNKQAITLAGGNKFALEAYKIKDNAKINAITSKLTDRDFAPTAGAAFKKILAGDAGELTEIYRGMSTDSKDLLRERIIKSFSDQEQTRKMDEAITNDANKTKGNALTLEFLTANGPRKREIVTNLVGLGQMTLQSAEDLLKPKDPSPNPVLAGALYDQIRRGTINSFQQLVPYSNLLSNSEFASLGRSVVDDQARKAHESIDRKAGITSSYIDPGAVKFQVKIDMTKLYAEELQKKVPNDQGVMIYQSPADAYKAAEKRYDGDTNNAKKEKARNEAAKQIEDTLNLRNIPKPALPTEQIDFSNPAFKKLTPGELDKLITAQKKYKDNIGNQGAL